jgi:hypothetical protein
MTDRMVYAGVNRPHTLAAVRDAGSRIELDDGTAWVVYEGFAPVCNDWNVGEMMTVKHGRDTLYPYKLINIHKNESVEARLQDDE